MAMHRVMVRQATSTRAVSTSTPASTIMPMPSRSFFLAHGKFSSRPWIETDGSGPRISESVTWAEVTTNA